VIAVAELCVWHAAGRSAQPAWSTLLRKVHEYAFAEESQFVY